MPSDNSFLLFGRSIPPLVDENRNPAIFSTALSTSPSPSFPLADASVMDSLSAQKPDKPVACPRCDSLDTKFCYFNNYNVKQPRHFCRSCQRYWTAGGTLRNVPVGAGRRKNKTSPSCASTEKIQTENGMSRIKLPESAQQLHSGHLSYIPASNADPGLIQAQPVNIAGASSPSLQQHFSQRFGGFKPPHVQNFNPAVNFPKEGFLAVKDHGEADKFSSFVEKADKPAEDHCLSMARKESQGKEERADASIPSQNKVDNSESTCCSSVTTTLASETPSEPHVELGTSSLSMAEALGLKNTQEGPGFSAQVNGPGLVNPAALMWPWIWPYALNNGMPGPVSNMPQPDATMAAAWAAAAAAAASFLPWPGGWNPFAWGAPWNYAWNANHASVNAAAGATTANSPLGKHPRSSAEEQEPLCVPKSLRIDHVDAAAHSSILTTLGVGGVPGSPTPATGFFNAFQPKADVFQPKLAGQAPPQPSEPEAQQQGPHKNPAAQARSVAFNESS